MTRAGAETLREIDPELAPPALPVGEVELINDLSLNGPMISRYSISDDGAMDMNLKGMLRLRRITVGADDSGPPLSEEELVHHRRIQAGIDEIRATGDLRGRLL
jgi:hypothetical protein